MKIAKGLEMLEIPAVVMGKQDCIYPTFLYDEKELVLIDTGFPGLLKEFREGLAASGHALEHLTKIILTHHDIDHVGCLSSILREAPQKPAVFAHQEEKPYVEGTKTPVKLAGLEASLGVLPEQLKMVYDSMKAFFDNNKVQIDGTLSDGQELPYCGGITVIAAPGHTPGHICLYHKPSKTLIAGDALGVEHGLLVKPSSHINFDNKLAEESLRKLSRLDINRVICYHGGLFDTEVNQRIAELALT